MTKKTGNLARAKSMRIVADDLMERVRTALRLGRTGDMEVIRYLAANRMVDVWVRNDAGVERQFDAAAVLAAAEVWPRNAPSSSVEMRVSYPNSN